MPPSTINPCDQIPQNSVVPTQPNLEQITVSTTPISTEHNSTIQSGPAPISGIEITLPIPSSSINNPSLSTTNTHSMVTRSKSGIIVPRALQVQHSTSLSDSHLVPKSVTHALQSPNWKAAMLTEYKALIPCEEQGSSKNREKEKKEQLYLITESAN
ncbi:hypothetical protein PIB30_017044 [Stylosanthes scabra]|uniref:Uncharacterized protein n=1 Tax=Stylosanthes scabra TaxID=79078 RepID=A0ABU6R7T3_9FABA|nr:hypothetical protein [Stylosanthes scabra]